MKLDMTGKNGSLRNSWWQNYKTVLEMKVLQQSLKTKKKNHKTQKKRSWKGYRTRQMKPANKNKKKHKKCTQAAISFLVQPESTSVIHDASSKSHTKRKQPRMGRDKVIQWHRSTQTQTQQRETVPRAAQRASSSHTPQISPPTIFQAVVALVIIFI